MAHDTAPDEATQQTTAGETLSNDAMTPHADWPAGVPAPVELEFTSEEEAALDAYWEEVAAATAARDAARTSTRRRAHTASANID